MHWTEGRGTPRPTKGNGRGWSDGASRAGRATKHGPPVEAGWPMTVSEKPQRLAWVVLRTADRTQARGSSVRLVAPRAPEVAGELEPLLGEAELLRVEEYLLERGYVAPANIGLTWGTYTITPAAFHWLKGGLLEEQ